MSQHQVIDLIATFANIENISDEDELKNRVLEIEQTLSVEELALALEGTPHTHRAKIWRLLSHETQSVVFMAMREETRKILIKLLENDECKALLESFDAEALLELAEELPERFLNYAHNQLDKEEKQRFENASRYPDDQLGHWLSFQCPQVSQNLKVLSAKNILKKAHYPYLESIYTIDKEGKLVGEIPLHELYDADEQTPLKDIQKLAPKSLRADTTLKDASMELVQSEMVDLPVVDFQGVLMGRYTLAKAYQDLKEATDAQVAASGGLSEDEDLFAPVLRSTQNRAIWLGINLLTAFLASWFIGLFEATLQQIVALAVLMPVVASMGGISGSQTLTVIVRGLALGQITDANRKALLQKEFRVGCINGLLWALVVGGIAYLWFGDWMLGFTILIAIFINILAAVVSGVFIPSILHRINIDPALSGAVILTTVTDIVGFVAFLGLGTILLV